MKKIIVLMIMLTVAISQAVAVELSFVNPTLQSGVAKKVGAVYKFSNVTSGVDALVKILKLNNYATLADIDVTSYGIADAFQPSIKTGRNNDSSIDFEITFVEHGTSTEKKLSLDATGADIDGDDSNIKEYILLSTPKSYSLETPTRLVTSNSSDGLYVIPDSTEDVTGITVTEKRNLVRATYEDISKIYYTIGAKNAYGNTRLNSLYFKDIVFSNPETVELVTDPNESNESIILTGKLRDFYDWSKDKSKNSDFEHYSHGLVTGLVNDNLGGDKKPQFRSSYGSLSVKSISSAETFSQWFNDVEGINRSMPYELQLKKQGGFYVYDSDVTPVGDTSGKYKGFFPLDELLIGNEGHPHNYHFTYQINSQFTYQGGEIFTFSGDDDVWVFINGKLAVDVGGVHSRVEKSINLDDEAANLGITVGGTYAFDFFFAERHQTGSNLKITTSMVLEDTINPEPEPEPNIDSCKSTFSSVLNSTSATGIELHGNGRIYNNNQPLTTKSLVIKGPGQCDGEDCTMSDTLAQTYDVTVTKGSGKDGIVSLRRSSNKDITDSKEYLSLTADDSSVVNINGDVTIKVKNTFTINGDAQLNINGNVTIYADNISIAGKMDINTDNGVLTLIANNIDWRGNTTVNSHANPNLVLLSTGKIDIHGTSDLTAIIYAGTTAELYGNNRLTGSITAAKIRMYGHDYVTYDSSLVDAYCGLSNTKPVISISDSSVVEGDDGDENNLIFNVTLDKDAGEGVSFNYELFDATYADSLLNANADDYEKLNPASSIILEGPMRSFEIKVPIKGDTIVEKDEEFRIKLTDVVGAELGRMSAIGTILDDDGAIGCIEDAWIVKDDNSLYKMDILKKTEEEFADTITVTNAIGYNETDGYIWGYNIADNNGTLVKIGRKYDGTYKSEISRAIVGLPSDISIFVGDVDSHGHLYLLERKNGELGLTAEQDIVYVVDLNDSSANYLEVIESYEIRDYNRGVPRIGKGLDIVDWAFHPKNGKLYSASSDGRFYEIDPLTHTVNESQSITGLDDSTDYETFFDENGYFYLYGKKIGKVYRLDLTDPVNPSTDAILFVKGLGTSQGGDTARCAKAPMGSKPIVSLKSSVLEAEGDSGTTSIVFEMDSDRAFDSSFSVSYEVSSGSAKIDDDFVKTSGSVECVITNDGYSANCELPIVKGDIIKEADETFTVSFTSDQILFINNENKTTGTITNDDENSFTAYDVVNSAREIRTKIVGKDFNLTVARLDSFGALTSFGDENSTKVRIIDSSLCGSFDGDMSGFEDINIHGVSSIRASFNIPYALKRAKVQIFWIDEDDTNQTVCSADSFAIRPDHYAVNISPNVVAGEDFNLTIEAKDVHGNVVSNYNEHYGVYILDTTETKASVGCTLGTLETINQTSFVDGVSTRTMNYKDIGRLQFVVNEVNSTSSEYAHVDANDGSFDDRFITSGTTSYKIEPAKIKADFTIYTKNGKNYTYYSDDPTLMGAVIDTNVTMLNGDNNKVSNFSSTCWAEDVSITIDYQQQDGLPAILDAAGTSLVAGKLKYTISKGTFVDGNATKEIEMNFHRNVNIAKAPIKIKLSSPYASLSNGLDTNVTLEKNIDFVYARAHAPKVQSVVDQNMQAVVVYEAYIPKTVNKSLYGFTHLKVSEDFGDWYLLPDDATFGFATGFNPYARFSGVSIESFDSHQIALKAIKTPHSNRIFFTPKEYLLYNQFNVNAKVDSFQVNFYSKNNSWTGKGSHGVVFDDKASKHGLKKMDW